MCKPKPRYLLYARVHTYRRKAVKPRRGLGVWWGAEDEGGTRRGEASVAVTRGDRRRVALSPRPANVVADRPVYASPDF